MAPAPATFETLPLDTISLLPGIFRDRAEVNRAYLLRLETASLLQNHYLEAGLWQPAELPTVAHGGWESPTSQVRGHFLGHWLSAASRLAAGGDRELGGKAAAVVAALARCQAENGGEWVFPIPAKFLDWVARGKQVWAPHYTIHKTLMGLVDAARHLGSEQALEVLEGAARWFSRWTAGFDRGRMDDILDVETGGMLEAWADLYGLTGRQEHLDLVARYDRPRLFERLLAGEDPLTNRHANTTIPEAHGAARAYEVTGDARWRRIVEGYWKCAVTARGTFCTGSQTSGEIWTPLQRFAARLSDKTQEHCVVYNMSRLADYLLRWTGDASYAEYVERNLYNGTLAQQHPRTGMITYFLPLCGGARKSWGSPTSHFWCCHGSLVQAHTTHASYAVYRTPEGVAVAQYVPAEARVDVGGVPVTVRLTRDPDACATQACSVDGPESRPMRWVVEVRVRAERQVAFDLALRVPEWTAGEPAIAVNGAPVPGTRAPGSFATVRRSWKDETVRMELPFALRALPIPDDPGTVAFLEGPIVLAALGEATPVLRGDPRRPDTMLTPAAEREWRSWRTRYHAVGPDGVTSFVPLHEVVDEPYSVYLPVRG